jgi:hypothetical protein
VSYKSGMSRAVVTTSLLLCCAASSIAQQVCTSYCFQRYLGSGSSSGGYKHTDTVVRAYNGVTMTTIRGWGNFDLAPLKGADPKSFSKATLYYYERSVSGSAICSLRYVPHFDESTWPANTVWDSLGFRGQSHYPFGSELGAIGLHDVELTPWDSWPTLAYNDRMAIAWLTVEAGSSHEGRDDGWGMTYPPFLVFEP